MDDPEGNLVIVERVVHESQRHFPYWEHSWVGTAHIPTSTPYGTLTTHHRRIHALTSIQYGTFTSHTPNISLALMPRKAGDGQKVLHGTSGTVHKVE